VQGGLDGIADAPDIAAVVQKTVDLLIQKTIDIPRTLVVPQGEVKSGFKHFELDLTGVRYQPPSKDLLLQYLRTHERETIGLIGGGLEEERLENYIVRRLIDFDDVAYDTNAELLYGLAGQVVVHLQNYLSEEETHAVLRFHEREIAQLVHVQMQDHYWEDAVGYDVRISKGFTQLRDTAFSQTEATMDFRIAPADKSNMSRYLFGGFSRCLYPVQKFQAEQERILAVIVRGQFQLYYRQGAEHLEYQPDFVAETEDAIYMLEPKRRSDMEDAEVLAKRDAAVLWCQRATSHAATYGGKPWSYALIPHDAIAENITLEALARSWSSSKSRQGVSEAEN